MYSVCVQQKSTWYLPGFPSLQMKASILGGGDGGDGGGGGRRGRGGGGGREGGGGVEISLSGP